jgi:Holliday junction DNA helicase RuvA
MGLAARPLLLHAMIHHLKGRLVEKHPTHVVIECDGVGYFVNISLHTYALIPDEETLQLFTHLHVREDAHTLYGFMQLAERDIFRLLISVSGIGTSTARTMLSSMSPAQIRDAIAGGDVPAIQAVKGIGTKTAQRVIIDLKDKVLKIYDMAEVSEKSDNTNKEEALSALEVLGFATKQAEKAVDKVLSGDPSLSVEAIIKQALKNL